MDKTVDKTKSLDLAISQLEKTFGKGTVMRLGSREKLAVKRPETISDQLEKAAAVLADSRNQPVYFHCHHGMRSRNAAEHFLREGFRNVWNVEGGIEAWSLKVDPAVRRY